MATVSLARIRSKQGSIFAKLERHHMASVWKNAIHLHFELPLRMQNETKFIC